MLADHDDAGELLAEIRALSNGIPALRTPLVLPTVALYHGLEEFERDLHHHVHLENNILFPRALHMEQGVVGDWPMNTISEITAGPSAIVEREVRMQRMLIAYILTGLLFLLLPGTFLGVWNLISISSRHALDSLSPAWIQAHGHAQIFGWIGTFILGIGFYSLTKMGRLPAFAIPRGWTCFALWTAGITLRWFEGVVGWQWRVLLPLSALLELAAFLMFFRTVSSHRPAAPVARAAAPRKPEPWMLLVMGSTFGFLVTLVMNFTATSGFDRQYGTQHSRMWLTSV